MTIALEASFDLAPVTPACGWASADMPLSDAQQRAWLECVERDNSASPDLHPVIVQSAADSAGVAPVIFTRGSGNTIDSIAPFLPTTVKCSLLPGKRVRREIKGLRLVGANIVGGTPSTMNELPGALLSELDATGREFALFEDIEKHGPLWKSLTADLPRDARLLHYREATPNWIARIPDDPEEYWRRFSGKDRREWRRIAKKLPHETCVYTKPAEVEMFLMQADAITRKSWQWKRHGRGLVFSGTTRTHLQRLASIGALHAMILSQDQKPIAYLWGMLWNRIYTGQDMAFDASFARNHPGQVLFIEHLEHLINKDHIRVFGMGPGAHDYKAEFGTDCTEVCSLVLARRGSLASQLLSLDAINRRATMMGYRLAKSVLQRANAFDKLRQMHHGTK